MCEFPFRSPRNGAGVVPNVAGSTLAWGLQMPLYQQLKALCYEDLEAPKASTDSVCSLVAGGATNLVAGLRKEVIHRSMTLYRT